MVKVYCTYKDIENIIKSKLPKEYSNLHPMVKHVEVIDKDLSDLSTIEASVLLLDDNNVEKDDRKYHINPTEK